MQRDDRRRERGAGWLRLWYMILVYTVFVQSSIAKGLPMKNITFSADEQLIEAARERARAEHTTLNEQFRQWLEDYARRDRNADEAMALVERMRGYVRTGGRKFTRDQMNER